MRKILMATLTGALFVLPTISYADDTAVPGAATGAIIGGTTGAVIGGPVGAAVSPPRADVVIEHRRAPAVSRRTGVKDAMGNVVCNEVRRQDADPKR